MIPFVDTNIVPDRNAGIGSLLWDLQNPQDPDRDGPPLLDPVFAFIDVGVSRAAVSIALKTLLSSDLEMNVDYVATERIEAMPYANVTFLGDRAEKIRGCLSRMVSSKEALDTSPIVTEADLVLLGFSNTDPGGNNRASEQAWSVFRDGPSHRVERCCRER